MHHSIKILTDLQSNLIKVKCLPRYYCNFLEYFTKCVICSVLKKAKELSFAFNIKLICD